MLPFFWGIWSLWVQYLFLNFKVCTWKTVFGNSRSAGKLIFSANLWKVQPHICQPSSCPKGITWCMQRTRTVIERVFLISIIFCIVPINHHALTPLLLETLSLLLNVLLILWVTKKSTYPRWSVVFYKVRLQVLSEQLQTELSASSELEALGDNPFGSFWAHGTSWCYQLKLGWVQSLQALKNTWTDTSTKHHITIRLNIYETSKKFQTFCIFTTLWLCDFFGPKKRPPTKKILQGGFCIGHLLKGFALVQPTNLGIRIIPVGVLAALTTRDPPRVAEDEIFHMFFFKARVDTLHPKNGFIDIKLTHTIFRMYIVARKEKATTKHSFGGKPSIPDWMRLRFCCFVCFGGLVSSRDAECRGWTLMAFSSPWWKPLAVPFCWRKPARRLWKMWKEQEGCQKWHW